MKVRLEEFLLGAASALALVGVLACSLLCIPWHLLPDSGASLAVISLAAALGAAGAARRARGVVRVAVWLAAVALAALSLAAVGSALGFRVVPRSPYSSATLAEVPCNGPVILDVAAIPFHIHIEPWDGEVVSAVVEAPSNLIGEVRESTTVSHEVDPSDGALHLRIESRYRRPIALGWTTLSQPELTLRVRVPSSGVCGVLQMSLYTVSGDVSLRVDAGEASIQSVHGGLRIEGRFGTLEADTVSGDISLLVELTGDGTARTTSGDISGEIAISGSSGGGGSIHLSTTSGDVEVEVWRGGGVRLQIRASTTSGRATLEDAGGGLNVASASEREVSGGVGTPDGREFTLVAETTGGDVAIRYAGVRPAG